jgi:hypothetical protein
MMALVLVLVSVMTVVLLAVVESRPAVDLRRAMSSDDDLLRAREAVMAWYLTNPDDGVPCPDTNGDGLSAGATDQGGGCGTVAGTLPYKRLGTTRDIALDLWGQPLTYVVGNGFFGGGGGLRIARTLDASVSFAGGTLVENQAQSGVTDFPFVIVSHGPAGPGLGGTGGSTAEDENADDGTDGEFIVAPAAPEAATALRFDDRLTWPNMRAP